MHPIGSLFVGLIAGWIFVKLFTIMQQTKKIDDVLAEYSPEKLESLIQELMYL